MANSDKNIRITANRDTTALPKIIFTGQSNNPIALNVLDDNTISFEGSAGQLFSINNNLSSGYIFSINDISGIPSFRVNADGTVGIAEFLGNVGIGLTNPAYKLQISGSAGISGTANISGVLTLSSTTGSGSTTTGALVVSGGVGIGGSIFSSSAYASSLSGVVFNNGAITNTGTITSTGVMSISNSSTTAFQVRDGSNSSKFNVDTIGGIVSVLSSTASTSTSSGSLVVSGGVGIGGSIIVGGRVGIGTVPNLSMLNIQTSSAGTTGLSIIASSSQSAPLLEWWSYGGIIGLNQSGRIKPTGELYLGNQTYTNLSSGTNPLFSLQGRGATEGMLIKGFNSGASEVIFEVQGNTAAQLFGIYGDGGVNAPRINVTNSTGSTNSSSGALIVTGGVGIGGTLSVNTANVIRDFNHTPNITTIGGASGWVASTASTFISPGTFRYLNNKYIGIGGTYIYYSDDMLNWSSVMVPNLDPARPISNITYGEGKYVFVQYYTANAGYSTNLTNWTNVAIQYQTWNDVIYGNGRFVATVGGDLAAYSLDGTSWTSVTDSIALGFNTSLKFLNGYFYVTNANAISRSIDGIIWQVCNTPAVPYGLAYGNGLYVGGIYNSGTIVYSYDGLNFSSYSGSSFVHNGSFFYNGVYYLTTQNNNVIRYSTDGFNWTNSTGFPGAVFNLQYIKGFLYAGSGNTVWVTNATPGRFEVNPLRTGTLDDVEIGRLSPNNANFIDVSVNNNLNVSSQYSSTSPLNGALTVAGGVGIGGSLYVASATAISGVTINAGVITGNLTGTATTATYSHQSGYAITSSSSGTATTANNVRIESAGNSNSSHLITFTPNSSSSGSAISSDSTFSFNPSTEILSVSGIAITSTTASTSTTTGALVVSGGVGIGGSVIVGGRVGIGTVPNLSMLNIQTSSAGTTGLSISASTSQSANLFEWYADGGLGGGYSLAGRVRPSGQVHLGHPGSLTMSNGGSALLGLQGRGSTEGLAIRGYNSNFNEPIFEIQGNAGNQLFGIYGDGGVNAPRINVTNSTGSTNSSTGALVVTGGVGIGQSLFTSSSYASSISGVILNNGSVTLSGTYTQGNSNTAAFVVKNAGGTSILNVDTTNSIVSVLSSTASTTPTTGALVVSGGVGISGRLSFNQAAFGTTGIATNPTMAMIGNTGDPIFLSILEDNTISFEGSQGQLFSITPNLSTGYIYSVNDITGIPLLRANANANVTANEYAGNFGIGLSNPGYKLHVVGSVGFTSTTASTSTTTGTLVVSGGVGIGGSLYVNSPSNISSVIINNGVITGNLTGTATTSGFATTASYSNQAGYAITAGSATTATYSHQAGYAITTGSATTAFTAVSTTSVSVASAGNSNLAHPILITNNPSSGSAVSSDSTFTFNPSTEVLSVSGIAVTSSTGSSNTTTGALVVSGGVGIGGSFNVGNKTRFNDEVTINSLSSNALTIGGSGSVAYTWAVGTTLSANRFNLGLDLSLSPIGGNQSVVQSFWGLQLAGNTGVVSTSFTPTSYGSAGAIGVLVPNQQSNRVAFGIIAHASQTADLQIWTSSTASTSSPYLAVKSDGQIYSYANIPATSFSSGALVVSGGVGIGGSLFVNGDLTINGTTTTINSVTISVDDKNIELGSVSSPSDVTAEGGGITLKGATDKFINWYSGVGWSSSESWNLVSGNSYKINNASVLTSTTLGTGVTNSSLTSLGTITTGVWAGTLITANYGGVGLTTPFTVGDILYANTSTTWGRLTAGTSGHLLSSTGTGSTPSYVNPNTLTVGSATTASNLRIAVASSNLSHPVLFTPGSSTSGSAVSSDSTFSFNSSTEILSVSGVAITSTTSSSGSTTGALTVAGGVGIGGTVNIAGDETVLGRLYYSQSTVGVAGTSTIPSISFIGQDNNPITLSVLTDNTLSFEGSSGQLFSINNNLSSGTIFSVNDISGIPIIRANANGTLSMGEFTGTVGVGLTNPSFKFHVSGSAGFSGTIYATGNVSLASNTASTSTSNGALTVSGGVGIGGSLYVASATAISGVTINAGVITGSLTGTASTATYSHQSGYAITSGFATTASYAYQSGYAITSGSSGSATTAFNINIVSATTNSLHPVLFTPASGTASGAALSTESTFVYNPSTDILSVSGLAVTATTASIGPTSGALVVAGGVGISGSLRVGDRANTSFSGYQIAGFAVSFNNHANFIIQNAHPGPANHTRLFLANDVNNYAEITYANSHPSFSFPNYLNISNTFGNIHISAGSGFTINMTSLRLDSTGAVTTVVTASTSPTTGGFRVAGGAGIAKTSYFGQDLIIQGTTGSGSTTTGALVVSGGVGIGQTLFTSSSYASSISGVILNNGAITNTGTITSTGVMSISNSSTTAFSVKDGSNDTKFNVNTIGGIVSISSSTASTNTSTGAFTVSGGVGIGGSLYVSSATAISGVTINAGVITGSLTGTASTATYSHQSGYAITSGSSGAATTATYAHQSGYATTSGFATSATSASIANTSYSVNVNSASANASHFLIFSPTATGSGVALSSESALVYNPSTDILSVSGLAVTSGTASTSATTGALVVTGGVGIGLTLTVGLGISTPVISAPANLLLKPGVDSTTGIQFTRSSAALPVLTIDTLNSRVGIGLTNPEFDFEVNGSISATTKSFVIEHPTKQGMKLRYGSLEGPENGVYVRGELKDNNTIILPDYWSELVDESSITVHLTPIGNKFVYVKEIKKDSIIVGSKLFQKIHCYYSVWAERKDVPKLKVEF